MLGAFVIWERRAESPMVPPALLRNRRFVAANTVFALLYFALSGMFFWVTLYFQDVRGWSALETGLSWLLLNTPFLAASMNVGRLARRYDGRLLIGAGSLIAAVGMVGLTLLSADTGFWLAAIGYRAGRTRLRTGRPVWCRPRSWATCLLPLPERVPES